MTLKKKKNISLTVSDEFIQYCEFNNIDDIEKTAKETFKRGFDLLKYGRLPESELTPQDKSIASLQGNKPEPSPVPKEKKEPIDVTQFKSPGVTVTEPPTVVEAQPMKSSNAAETFKKMGVIPKKRDDKSNLYDE